MDITPWISPIVTAALAVFGSWLGFSNRISKLEVLIGELRKDVEKHNQVVERTYKLETEMKTAFFRIDELKAKDSRIEDKIDEIRIGGTE